MSKLELSEIYTDYSAFATQKNEFEQGRLLFMTSLFALHYMDPVNLSLLRICQKGDHVCGLRHLGDINSQECLPPINSSAGTQFVSTFLPGEQLPDVKQQKRLINYLFPIGTGRRTHKHTHRLLLIIVTHLVEDSAVPRPLFCQHSKVSPSLLITSSKFFFFVRFVRSSTCLRVHVYKCVLVRQTETKSNFSNGIYESG